MTRLIEIEDARLCAPSLSLKVGDLVVFSASGGRMSTGSPAVRFVGVFIRAGLGLNKAILEPMGRPNAVVFEAQQQGEASIDVIIGDPFGTTATTTLLIVVDGPQ
jgi:hypothetical protein